jgi:hypothetical protein
MLLNVTYLYLLTMYFIAVPFYSTEMFENVRKLSSVLKNSLLINRALLRQQIVHNKLIFIY